MRTLLIIVGSAVIVGVAIVLLVVAAIIPVARSSSVRPVEHSIPQHLEAQLLQDGATIEISWTPVDVDGATLVLQRSKTGRDHSWDEIARFSKDSDTVTYREPWDGTAYMYRFLAFDAAGGSGMTAPVRIER